MKANVTLVVITEDFLHPDRSTVLIKRNEGLGSKLFLPTAEVTVSSGISSPFRDAATELLKRDASWWAPTDAFHLFAEHSHSGTPNLCFWLVFNNSNIIEGKSIDPHRKYIKCDSTTNLRWFGINTFRNRSYDESLGVAKFLGAHRVIVEQGIKAWWDNVRMRQWNLSLDERGKNFFRTCPIEEKTNDQR